ncbi:MAG: 4-hydroxy-tetrahydrodipicolinate reductase, partial [Geodermatophilaceae bacterium]|nr:4-hydroxy-tetrahydrodipicolinate reductase [Geodermatophilaceae bacterium]
MTTEQVSPDTEAGAELVRVGVLGARGRMGTEVSRAVDR